MGPEDARLARYLAEAAGTELLLIRGRHVGSDLRRAGDRGAQAVLAALLEEKCPGDCVLSEEGDDSSARLTARRVWIVDPLDGTREYSEPPRDDWAVHVALWEDGRLAAGAVSLPARGITYGTDEPPAVPPRREGPIRLAVSRSRPPAFVDALAGDLGAELVPMGSAGVKCVSVWCGDADAYVHAGGQFEWDSAAPVAVAAAAGLFTSRVDGSRLEYNRPDPLLPDLIVCRPEFSRALLEAAARRAVPPAP